MKNTFRNILAIAALLSATAIYGQTIPTPTTGTAAIHTSKTTSTNADGSYTLKLETFVEGQYTSDTKVVTTKNPVDFVLCLDVSGSMDDPLTNSTRLAYTDLFTGYKFNRTDRLDKEKGKQEGYYAATVSIFNTYRQVRWSEADQKWQFYNETKKAWQAIEGSGWSTSVYKSKLGVLVDACEAFLAKIEASQKEGAFNASNGHKVGIVTYGSTANDVIGLTSINSKQELIKKIRSLSTGGATRSDLGLENTVNMLKVHDNGSGRTKVAVLFTDGLPTTGTLFSETVANASIAKAKNIKSANGKVFTISVYESNDSNMTNYMNYVSSNYPSATSMSSSGDKASDNYYKQATNSDALNAAFESIATEATTTAGGAGIQLAVSDVTLKVNVSSSFLIPDGQASVKVYEALAKTSPVPSSTDVKDIQFETPTAAQKDVRPDGVNVEIVGNTVNVRGYDLSKNWVGYRFETKNKKTTKTVNPGAKLVIEVTIVPDPNADGGAVKPDDPDTGVHVGDDDVTPDDDNTVYTPKNLVLKSGSLASGKGESMLFLITNDVDPNFKMTVALTEGSTTTKTVAQLPVKDGDKTINYTVTPLNSWSWAYSTVNAKTQNLLDNNVFEFAPGAAGSTAKHAEDSKNNVFE